MPRPLLALLLALAALATAASGVAQTSALSFAPTDEIFPNPERGFYAHREVQAEGTPLSVSDLESLRSASVTLVLRLYYLKSFRDRPLSDAQLALIQTDMDALREAGAKAILRFAYSQSPTQPDAPPDVVLGHIEQLVPIFEANADVIAVVQAGFIGAWGEWYYTDYFANPDNPSDISPEQQAARREVLLDLVDALPDDRFVQIRTPYYKRDLLDRSAPISEDEAYGDSAWARIGHHNDCFLASPTDYGTFLSQADRDLVAADTRFSPSGGETCNVNPPRSECETALAELAAYRYSYLNKGYNTSVLGSWVRGGCMTEVRQRLGYRLALTTGRVTTTARPGTAFSLSLNVENRGWAAPYNPRPVEVVLRHTSTGDRYVARLADDPRFWGAGENVALTVEAGLPADLPEGDYDVLLNLPDGRRSLYERPRFSVRLANEGVWEEATGYNDLGVTLAVSASGPGEAYEGDLVFRPYEQATGAETSAARGTYLGAPFPNPAVGAVTIPFTTRTAGSVRLTVYDVLGRRVEALDEVRPAGLQTTRLETGGWAAGTYVIRLEAGGEVASRQVVLGR